MNVQQDRVRIYDTLRTAHLERLASFVPALTIFRVQSYDFDEELAKSHGVHRLSRLGMARWLLFNRPEAVETNEVLQINAWPTLLVVRIACMLRLQSGRPRRVFYAIENGDVVGSLSGRIHIPRWLARWMIRAVGNLLLGGTAAICYGTAASRSNYESLLPRTRNLPTTTIEALPSRQPILSLREVNRVVFVGAFEHRKGVLEAIDALMRLKVDRPDLAAGILGKGPLLSAIEERIGNADWIRLTVDPTRQEIEDSLRRAKVLVLFSQPTDRWREQVGLPIVEALAFGLEVVASDQTGLAKWLAGNLHQVVPSSAPTNVLADGVAKALDAPRSAEQAVSLLPASDARAAADSWLASAANRG